MNNENLVVSRSTVVQRKFMLMLVLLSPLVKTEAEKPRYSGSDRRPQSHNVDDRTQKLSDRGEGVNRRKTRSASDLWQMSYALLFNTFV
jgi:hypothetical protein